MEQKKGRKTHIKIRFFEKKPMDKRAVKHWAKHLRSSIKRDVWIPLDRKYFGGKAVPVPVIRLRNEKELEKLVDDLLPDGEYRAHGYTGRRSKYRKGLTKSLFRARKHTDGRGISLVNVWDTSRLSHYWFWKNRWKYNQEVES